MTDDNFVYDSCKHEVSIGNNYSLKVLNLGNAEVPMILKCWYDFRKTENPKYRDDTDNNFLKLDFIFDNQADADAMYDILKKGTLRRVERRTGRFKEEEATQIHKNVPTWKKNKETGEMEMKLIDYPQDKIVFPDYVKGSYKKSVNW